MENGTIGGGHYKELTVALSPIDEKALSRTTTRRRRRTTGGGADASAANVGSAEVLKEGAVAPVPVPAPQTMQPLSTPAPVPAASQAQPVAPVSTVQASIAAEAAITPVPTAPLVGGALRITAKKIASTVGSNLVAPAPAPAAQSIPKIIPSKKRISSAPASATLKKPRFVVSTLPGSAPAQAREVAEAPKHSSGEQSSLKPRRRFTERRISIEVKSAATTRKNRRHLKERIDSMPIAAVRKILLRKGILKPKATLPPETMMRSMLKDYMLLHAAE